MDKPQKAKYYRNWRKKNLRRSRAISRKGQRAYALRHPLRIMVKNAKVRSKRDGLEFNITELDLKPAPQFCPILGIKLVYPGISPETYGESASIDRIDSAKGYIRGNVRIISRRANMLKSDATVEELRAVLQDSLNILTEEQLQIVREQTTVGE